MVILYLREHGIKEIYQNKNKNWYSGIFFFLCGQKEETRKNRERAPPSNKWAFRCLAAELAASPLRQSSPETTPKSLICYRRLPLSFAKPTPRLLAWQTCEAVLIKTSSFRIGLNLFELFIRVNSVNSCSSETPRAGGQCEHEICRRPTDRREVISRIFTNFYWFNFPKLNI